MVENPASWGRAERVIHEALREADVAREAGVFGASRAAVVASALRREGLLSEEDAGAGESGESGESLEV